MANRLPGVDIIANITVKNSAGDAYDLTTDLEGLAVYVFVQPNRVIAKFSMNSVDGFSDMEMVDALLGQIKIIIPGSKTKGLNEVQLYAVAVAQVEGVASSLKFGTAEGVSFEVAYITNSPATDAPDLS